MWFNFKMSQPKEEEADLVLMAPISGTAIPIEDVPDIVFSEKIIGDGIAIKPTGNKIVAPCDCTVKEIFKTGHAVILNTNKGNLQLFVHIGIDTIDLGGNDIFRPAVKAGDSVKTGDVLIDFDLELLQKKLQSTISPFLISVNSLPAIASLEKITNRCTNGSTPVVKIMFKKPDNPPRERE